MKLVVRGSKENTRSHILPRSNLPSESAEETSGENLLQLRFVINCGWDG